MRRTIVAFGQDEAGDWVAGLSCLHRQHVRHRPPFDERAWVLDPAERDTRIGTDIDCPLCDRGELPEGLRLARNAGPFDQNSLPPGLLRSHRVPAGMWGVLRIHSGRVGLCLPIGSGAFIIEAGRDAALPPGVPHQLVLAGPVELSIDLLEADPDPQPGGTSPEEGGEPACWVHLVCADCGAVIDDSHRAGECVGR